MSVFKHTKIILSQLFIYFPVVCQLEISVYVPFRQDTTGE